MFQPHRHKLTCVNNGNDNCCYFCVCVQTIQLTQPDVVVVELCKSRINILSLDEETLLREAKNINLDKIRTAIRQVHVAIDTSI